MIDLNCVLRNHSKRHAHFPVCGQGNRGCDECKISRFFGRWSDYCIQNLSAEQIRQLKTHGSKLIVTVVAKLLARVGQRELQLGKK